MMSDSERKSYVATVFRPNKKTACAIAQYLRACENFNASY
jgi:hypothetical protein